MLRLDFLWLRSDRRFVESLNSESEFTLPPFHEFDTLEIAVAAVKRKEGAIVDPLLEYEPWSFSSIRASVGLIDAPPDNGTFKLRVDGQTTAAIAWPGTFADAAAIAAFKLTVLNALKALSNVADGDIVASDPTAAPANFLYFTWTGDADERLIEVVENRLAPVCKGEVTTQRVAPGMQQLIQLVQLPIALTSGFNFETAAQPTRTEQRAGGVGVNEIQRIVLPTTPGALELTWNGVPTIRMGNPGVTAAQLAAALNAIVVDGATNPSFRVTPLQGRAFDIEFIGPLAAANQPLLGATIYPSVPPTLAFGYLPLTSGRFGRALNGAESITLRFELVIVEAQGETRIIRNVTFLAAMTDAAIVQTIEDAGAIMHTETIVYVDDNDLTEYAEAAPGFSYTPASAAAAFAITHNLGTWQPKVRVAYKESASPERWRDLSENAEFHAQSTSANAVSISFPYALSADTESALYFGRFKIFIASPDATIIIFSHEHTWAQCRESLPSGMTLTAKLAAIDAALAMFGGTLTIDGGQITGTIDPARLDLTKLITLLDASSTYRETIREFLGADASFLSRLVETLTNTTNAATFTTLIEKFLESAVTNDKWSETLVQTFTNNTALNDLFRESLITLLQGGGTLPDGFLLMQADDLDLALPPYNEFDAGQGRKVRLYLPLAVAFVSTTSGATISGELAATGTVGERRVVSASARSPDYLGRPGRIFEDGETIAWNGRFWQAIANAAGGNAWYPAEYEIELFSVPVNALQLSAATQFLAVFTLQLKLASDNTRGVCKLIMEHAALNAEAGGQLNLSTLTWTSAKEVTINLGPTLDFHRFEFRVQKASGGAITGSTRAYNVSEAMGTAPATGNFIFRARLSQFDVQNISAPAGSLIVRRTATSASIAPL